MASKIILITGASSGIGAACAKRFADDGNQVVLVARHKDRLASVTARIESMGGKARCYSADLSSGSQVSATASRVLRDIGVPDVIINNAGAGRWAPLEQSSLDELRQMIEVPLLSALYVSRSFLPAMIERRSGSIVCVSSPASYIAWRDACGYIAARRGLTGFCDGLRLEVKRARLHVGLVVLGAVDTPYWSNNPDSHVAVPTTHPWLMPKMSAADAAAAIALSVRERQRLIVKPASFRALFALYAASPRLTERGMTLAGKYLQNKAGK